MTDTETWRTQHAKAIERRKQQRRQRALRTYKAILGCFIYTALWVIAMLYYIIYP